MVWILHGLGLMLGLLIVLIWAITFHPADTQAEKVVCSENAPWLQPGQTLKVLTYNV